MSNDHSTSKEIEQLLVRSDSPNKFYPKGFDYGAEYAHAKSMIKQIEQSTDAVAQAESPSVNQDGSRFMRFVLRDGASGAEVADVYLSSFGRLATIDGCAAHAFESIVQVLAEWNYRYVPIKFLKIPYNGPHETFVGMTWLSRYFTAWYRADDGDSAA